MHIQQGSALIHSGWSKHQINLRLPRSLLVKQTSKVVKTKNIRIPAIQANMRGDLIKEQLQHAQEYLAHGKQSRNLRHSSSNKLNGKSSFKFSLTFD